MLCGSIEVTADLVKQEDVAIRRHLHQRENPATVQVTGAGVCRNQANQLAGAGMLLKPVVVVGDLIALAVPPGDIADGVATADQDACLML